METVRNFETGLNVAAIRSSLVLSRDRMSTLLHVSSKSVQRWEREKRRPANADILLRLARLKEIVDLGSRVYTPEGLKAFLSTPLPVFGGRTAFDLIRMGEYEPVLAALAADFEGSGY